MSPPRFRVDFNELILPNVVLLSKGDSREDSDGVPVILVEGMRIVVWDEDKGDDGRPDCLVADGVAVLNKTGHFEHVKWCCLINGTGVQHQSDTDGVRD